jgi:hypothetical protein
MKMKIDKRLLYVGLLLIAASQLQGAANNYASAFGFLRKGPSEVEILDNIMTAILVRGDWNKANEFINRYADKIPQNEKNIFLRMAVQYKKLDSVKLLVDKGANIISKDYNGKSAMDYADEGDDQDIIDFLQSKVSTDPTDVAPAA